MKMIVKPGLKFEKVQQRANIGETYWLLSEDKFFNC